jgi:hypothetical protein
MTVTRRLQVSTLSEDVTASTASLIAESLKGIAFTAATEPKFFNLTQSVLSDLFGNGFADDMADCSLQQLEAEHERLNALLKIHSFLLLVRADGHAVLSDPEFKPDMMKATEESQQSVERLISDVNKKVLQSLQMTRQDVETVKTIAAITQTRSMKTQQSAAEVLKQRQALFRKECEQQNNITRAFLAEAAAVVWKRMSGNAVKKNLHAVMRKFEFELLVNQHKEEILKSHITRLEYLVSDITADEKAEARNASREAFGRSLAEWYEELIRPLPAPLVPDPSVAPVPLVEEWERKSSEYSWQADKHLINVRLSRQATIQSEIARVRDERKNQGVLQGLLFLLDYAERYPALAAMRPLPLCYSEIINAAEEVLTQSFCCDEVPLLASFEREQRERSEVGFELRLKKMRALYHFAQRNQYPTQLVREDLNGLLSLVAQMEKSSRVKDVSTVFLLEKGANLFQGVNAEMLQQQDGLLMQSMLAHWGAFERQQCEESGQRERQIAYAKLLSNPFDSTKPTPEELTWLPVLKVFGISLTVRQQLRSLFEMLSEDYLAMNFAERLSSKGAGINHLLTMLKAAMREALYWENDYLLIDACTQLKALCVSEPALEKYAQILESVVSCRDYGALTKEASVNILRKKIGDGFNKVKSDMMFLEKTIPGRAKRMEAEIGRLNEELGGAKRQLAEKEDELLKTREVDKADVILAELTAFRGESKAGNAAIREQIATENAATRDYVGTENAATRAHVGIENAATRAQIGTENTATRAQMSTGNTAITSKLDANHADTKKGFATVVENQMTSIALALPPAMEPSNEVVSKTFKTTFPLRTLAYLVEKEATPETHSDENTSIMTNESGTATTQFRT